MNQCDKISYIVEQITAFTMEEQKEVYEYLNHNEWGIALETLSEILCTRNIIITRDIYKQIKNAGEKMEMDSSTWEIIEHLIR